MSSESWSSRPLERLDAVALAMAEGSDLETVGRLLLETVLADTNATVSHLDILGDGRVSCRATLPRDRALIWEPILPPRVPDAGSIPALVTGSGRSVVMNDVHARASLDTVALAEGTRSAVGVPIACGTQIAAVLTVEWAQPHGSTPMRVAHLERLAPYLSLAISQARQRDAAERQQQEAALRAREQVAIAEATAAIAGAHGLDEALRALIEGMHLLTGADRGGVRLARARRRTRDATADSWATGDHRTRGPQVVADLADHTGIPAPSEAAATGSLDDNSDLYLYWSGSDYRWFNQALRAPRGDTRDVLAGGHGTYTPDVQTIAHGPTRDRMLQLGVRSALIVPLRTHGEVIGALHAGSSQPGGFSAELLVPLQVLADQAAGAVARELLAEEQAHLHAQVVGQLRQMTAARRFSAAAHAATDVGSVLRPLLDEAAKLLGATRGVVALAEPGGLIVRGSIGATGSTGLARGRTRPTLIERAEAEAIGGAQQIVTEGDSAGGLLHGYTGRRIVTPITHAGAAIGLVTLTWVRDEMPSREDLGTLQLMADLAGSAIARARLVEHERALLIAERGARAALEHAHVGLAASESRFRRLVDANMFGVTFGDMRGAITEANDAFLQLVGFSREELAAGEVRWDLLTAPAYRDADTAALAEMRARGACTPYEKEYVTRDGRHVPVLVGLAALYDVPNGWVAFVVDLTERRRTAVERDSARAAQARAEGAVRTGRAVAHELGSPLGTVLGLASLLLDDPRLPADVLADIRTLYDEASRAGALLRRFGAIARYEEMPSPAGPQLDVERASGE